MGPPLGCVWNKSQLYYTPRGNPGAWGPEGHDCLAQEAGLNLESKSLTLPEVTLPGTRKQAVMFQLCLMSKVGFL